MKWIVLLLFIVSLVDLVYCNTCCTDGKWVTSDEKCSDGKTINLQCDDNSTIVLNPKHEQVEQFFIKEDEDGLVIEERDRSWDCLTHPELLNGSITQNHTTVICNNQTSGPSFEVPAQRVFLACLVLMSVISFVIIIAVYLKIPELLDLQGRALLIFITITMISFTLAIFNIIKLTKHFQPYELCFAYAYVGYFTHTAKFSWWNVVSFNLLKSVVFKSVTYNECKLMMYYMLWGFGFPTLLTGSCLIYRYLNKLDFAVSFGTEDFCWIIDTDALKWTFYIIPRTFFFSLNFFMFSWISWKLWRNYFDYNNMAKVHSERSRTLLYIRLFLIMGIPWILDVTIELFYKFLPEWAWSITDVFSFSEGITMLLVLVVFRRRVKKGLAKHKVWGINWPAGWMTEEDEESQTFAMGIELPQNRDETLQESPFS